MKKYHDYLPIYLWGENIEAHSRILEGVDHMVDHDMNLLSSWCGLPRPVLIQREALALDQIHMIVHVHIPQIIKKITITGEYQYTREYSEADLTSDATIDFYIRGDNDSLKMPELTVTVETYDEITYTKSYPENDTATGSSYDHDEFLDRIGRLLGVPRRIYTEYNFTDAADTTPSYFGKEVESGVVLSCTEDDYYYQERLQYFFNNFGKKNLAILMLELLYGYEGVVELNSTLLTNGQFTDFLEEQNSDFLEHISAGSYIFILPPGHPVNCDDLDAGDKVEFLGKYLPVTRYAVITDAIGTVVSVEVSDLDKLDVAVDYTLLTVDDEPLETDAPVLEARMDSMPVHILPVDTNGDASEQYQLLSRGGHTLTVEYPGELFYSPTRTITNFKYILDDVGRKGQTNTTYKGDNTNTVTNNSNPYETVFTQASTSHPSTDEYDTFMRHAWSGKQWTDEVWQYITFSSTDSYSIGMSPQTPREYYHQPAYTGGEIPTGDSQALWTQPLTGSHTLAFQYGGSTFYLDGVEYTDFIAENMTVGDVLRSWILRIHDKDGVVTMPWAECKVSHYMPLSYTRYTLDGDVVDVIDINQFMDGEGTIRIDLTAQDIVPFGYGYVLPDGSIPGNEHNEYFDDYMDYEGVIESVEIAFIDDEMYYSVNDEEWIQASPVSWLYPYTPQIILFHPVEDSQYFTLHQLGYTPTTPLELSSTGIKEDVEVSLSCDVQSLYEYQVEDSTVNLTATLTGVGEETVYYGEVEFYKNDTLIDTVTTFNGEATLTHTLTVDDSHDDITFYAIVRETRITNPATSNTELLQVIDTTIPKVVMYTPSGLTAGETCTLEARVYNTTIGTITWMLLPEVASVTDVTEPTTPLPLPLVLPFEPLTDAGGNTVVTNVEDAVDGVVSAEVFIPSTMTGNVKLWAKLRSINGGGNSNTVRCSVSPGIVVPPVVALDTTLSLTTSLTSDTILSTQLTSTSIPVSVSLMTDESTPAAVSGASIGLYYYDGSTETLLDTVTTDNNGEATTTLTGLTTTSNSTIEIRAKYTATTTYNASNDTLSFNILTLTDPMTDYLTLSNWSMGSSATGTLSTPTSSNLSVNTTNNTLTDQNTNYFIYNKTLQDFFDYYGDEFSFIAYKTGGDGRYKLGFVNTTNGNILGYQAGTATNQEANSSCSQSEVVYQKYNQITFKKIGTDIHVYWKKGGTTYVDCTLAMGSIDTTKYYFFFKSDVRAGLTLTTDTTKIDHYSRDPNNN